LVIVQNTKLKMLETLFIAVEIYAVIWEILILNGVIVMPHLFWYGTSGDSPEKKTIWKST